MRALAGAAAFRYEDTRSGTLDCLQAEQPDLVYFYCHGGVKGIYPFLRVGPRGARGITSDNLFAKRVAWRASRPLVFINGCNTTALDPETAVEFVSFFVGDAWASGVIGTEITVFEELASVFAERFLEHFSIHLKPVGDSVRLARIDLLTAGNPLGLVYIPFGLATLRLAG